MELHIGMQKCSNYARAHFPPLSKLEEKHDQSLLWPFVLLQMSSAFHHDL